MIEPGWLRDPDGTIARRDANRAASARTAKLDADPPPPRSLRALERDAVREQLADLRAEVAAYDASHPVE